MTLMIASAEIAGSIFLLIILVSMFRGGERKNSVNRVFFALTLITMLGLIFDALSYVADIKGLESTFLLLLINVLAYSAIDVCIVLFAIYMILFIRKTRDVSFRSIYPATVLSALNILAIIVGAINGEFVSAKNGVACYGSWYDAVIIMPVVGTVTLFVVLVVNLKNLEKKDAMALGSFVIIPMIATVLLIVYPGLELEYLASAMSCTVIYTFIRREEIDEARIREQIQKEYSTLDALTGLLNRRGYNEAIAKATGHDSLGVVFCDLNALKYTNDSFGHAAGDAYIQRFADILRKVFGDFGHISRISGDEFVVLMYGIAEDKFNELKVKLNHVIKKNERMASAGYAFGDDSAPLELIKRAEGEMYEDKNRYYRDTGKDRRRTGVSRDA